MVDFGAAIHENSLHQGSVRVRHTQFWVVRSSWELYIERHPSLYPFNLCTSPPVQGPATRVRVRGPEHIKEQALFKKEKKKENTCSCSYLRFRVHTSSLHLHSPEHSHPSPAWKDSQHLIFIREGFFSYRSLFWVLAKDIHFVPRLFIYKWK